MPAHELPIDIPYAKLVEWLISRQKLAKDWHRKLQAIKAKAAEAAKDLPAELSLPEGEPLEYEAVKLIRDTLAKTAEKTFFGNLTGTAGMWDKILRAYERDNIFLGEVGQLLVRNVDFEIPYLKQQAAKEQQQLADQERKHTEHLHSAVQAAKQYQQECQSMGIKGVDITQELQALTKGLPAIFLQAAEQLQCEGIGEACAHYAAFVSVTLSTDSPQSATALLPAMHHVREAHLEAEADLGGQEDSCTSEQTQDSTAADPGKPLADSASSRTLLEEHADSAGQDTPATKPEGGEISWDIDMSAAEGADQEEDAPADIDWDADPVPAPESEGDAGTGNIDWDIAVNDDATQVPAPAAPQGGIVGEMASDGDFRSSLVNELHELIAFLQARLSEAGSMQILRGSQGAHTLLEPVPSATLKQWLQELREAAGHITAEKTQQLLLFQTSERHLSRVAAALQHKAGQEAKFRRQAQQVEARRQNIRSTLSAGSAKLVSLLDKTRAVKQLAEEALSGQLDRTVLIVGEINNLLD